MVGGLIFKWDSISGFCCLFHFQRSVILTTINQFKPITTAREFQNVMQVSWTPEPRRYLMDGLLNGRTTIKKKTLPITVPITNESIYVFTCVLPDSTIFFQIGAIEPPISLMDTTSGGLLVFCSPSFTFWMLTMFEPDVIIMNNVISERPLTSCGHAGGMFTNGPRAAVCCQWLYEQSFSTSRSSSIFKM